MNRIQQTYLLSIDRKLNRSRGRTIMAIILYPPTIDWTWMKQRPQQLLSRFAANGHTVYYANRNQKDGLSIEVEPRLYVIPNWDLWVQEDLPIIRKNSNEPIGIWCSNPRIAWKLPYSLVDWVIYDCVDDFAEWHPYEKDMIRHADIIICTSQRIYQRMKRISHLPTYLVRNGYDPNMGLHLPPTTIQSERILGYVGAWAPWIHTSILNRCSQLTSTLVQVIGPEFGRKFPLYSDIKFFNKIPHDQIAQHIRQFAICLIPFRINAITLATNPVKAYEYLASGKPVISTALPECAIMKPHIDIANNIHTFIDLVEWRLKDPGDPQPRIDFALQNTWQHRYFEIKQCLPKEFLF